MSHPQPQLRAFLDDGAHSGQTITVEPDADGQPPTRIVVHVPPDGEQVQQRPPDHVDDDTATPDQSTTTYELTGADEDLGLWVYRAAGTEVSTAAHD